jgi:membrane protease YdiL (CAAX protease family)
MHTRDKDASSQWLRILQFPVTRLVILFAIIFYLYISGHIFRAQYAHNPIMNVVVVLWMILITMSIYAAFVRYVERRPVSELATPGMGREFGTGLLMGFGLFVVCILILMVPGIYKIEGLNKWDVLLGTLWMGLSSGFFEEMLFRGVLFRIAEESMGTWVALAVSSLAFGLIHLQNPGATFQGVLFIAIEGGMLLAAAYILTRRLWMSMGFHMAWNYTQSSVFPGIGSGNPSEYGLVRATVNGPELLTGGEYGIEFSLIGLLVLTTTGLILLIKAVRRGKIVPPCWKRATA